MTHEEYLTHLALIRGEVTQIAQEFPDYIYQYTEDGCVYRPTSGNPNGCIVGFAMRRLGYEGSDEMIGGANASLPRFFKGELTTETYNECVVDDLKWIQNVQIDQDVGAPWSEAITRADDYLKENQ